MSCIPIEIVNKILIYRPTHELAKIIKDMNNVIFSTSSSNDVSINEIQNIFGFKSPRVFFKYKLNMVLNNDLYLRRIIE
jgi:hypothetical protein